MRDSETFSVKAFEPTADCPSFHRRRVEPGSEAEREQQVAEAGMDVATVREGSRHAAGPTFAGTAHEQSQESKALRFELAAAKETVSSSTNRRRQVFWRVPYSTKGRTIRILAS
jgi:hypothetical protein